MDEDSLSVSSVKEPLVLVSGGLQQYLIRHSANLACRQPCKGEGSDTTTFHDLPDSLQLHIFSFLSAEDLCRICRVSRHWYSVSCDNILWHRRLQADIENWNIIGHSSNPDAFSSDSSELLNKDIYLRCSPLVAKLSKQKHFTFHRLSDMLRSIWPKKPKLVMFGPGLESSTSGIVRKILHGHSDLFTVVNMFPGQFDGIGSGFTLKTVDEASVDLITLYTATRSERESRSAEQRASQSRLLAVPSSTSGDLAVSELQPAVKELCRTLDGFIYVVDATVTTDHIRIGRAELFAMVNDEWSPSDNPVLVLSCVPDSNSTRLGCINVVRNLELQKLSRPWQVHDCTVETMNGIEAAFHWLVQTCHRK